MGSTQATIETGQKTKIETTIPPKNRLERNQTVKDTKFSKSPRVSGASPGPCGEQLIPGNHPVLRR